MTREEYVILQSQYYWLSNIFNAASIRDLANGKTPEQVTFCRKEKGLSDDSIANIINEIYFTLLDSYQNEYVYKNEILNRLIDYRHDGSISHILSEFPVADSRADLAVFNGTSTCYEIKTSIDTIRRLSGQISDYTKLFEFVYLVVSESKYLEATDILPSQIGMIVFDERGGLEVARSAESNMDLLDNFSMFRVLHKAEYIDFSIRNNLISSKDDEIAAYLESKDFFLNMTSEMAHEEMMKYMRLRKVANLGLSAAATLPHSLVGAYFSTKMSKAKWQALISHIS